MNITGNKNIIILLASVVIVISVVLILMQKGFPKKTDYEVEIMKLQTQASSDNVEAIEKDLLNTDLENLDYELQDIEKELDLIY